MTYARIFDRLKKAFLGLGLAALPLLGWQAYAQIAQEEPIRGTIAVTEGADYTALAKISLEEARAAALAESPDATCSEGELDDEDGYLVYEIELVQDGREVDVLIDAGNAAVLEVDRDEDRDCDLFDD